MSMSEKEALVNELRRTELKYISYNQLAYALEEKAGKENRFPIDVNQIISNFFENNHHSNDLTYALDEINRALKKFDCAFEVFKDAGNGKYMLKKSSQTTFRLGLINL